MIKDIIFDISNTANMTQAITIDEAIKYLFIQYGIDDIVSIHVMEESNTVRYRRYLNSEWQTVIITNSGLN